MHVQKIMQTLSQLLYTAHLHNWTAESLWHILVVHATAVQCHIKQHQCLLAFGLCSACSVCHRWHNCILYGFKSNGVSAQPLTCYVMQLAD